MIAAGAAIIVVGAVGLTLPFVAVSTANDWQLLEEVAQTAGAVASGSAPTVIPEDTEHKEITDRLIIPKIKVDMPLVAGADADALLKGGWLFPGTAQPGQEGNAVIFGHRFRYLPPVSNTFFHLDKLVQDDRFIVRWNGEEYVYRVLGTSIVAPDNFSVLAAEPGKKRITLITCAPAFSTKERLVILAELVE